MGRHQKRRGPWLHNGREAARVNFKLREAQSQYLGPGRRTNLAVGAKTDNNPGHEDMKKQKSARKYGKKAATKVKRAMHEMKRGELKSGRSGKKVTSRKQAIAIGLSEARRAGGKVPQKKMSTSSSKRSRSKSGE